MVKLNVFIALALIGCHGSFEEAKNPHMAVGAPPQSERCAELDDRAAWTGGAAKFTGALSGASGLATIVVDDDMDHAAQIELGLAITSGVMGAAAVGALFVSDAAATSWARECAQ